MVIRCVKSGHSALVERFLTELKQASKQGSVLDLACGSGRNGLYLARLGIPVVFADHDADKLSQIDSIIQTEKLPAKTWLVDLEAGEPLVDTMFGAIIVFRYLHRPLFKGIKASIADKGLVIYETFNEVQRAYGRPHNPHFLLRENELVEQFDGWQIIHQFEGTVPEPECSISQIVALRKPR
ncbi:hypothetical protein [Photobacterium sp.]|uniref:hypothetical protein n=1 Tax=Photobacterium sp. TaxID=660 RepID=UPI00299DC92F|nr:hypothetical protein [Photobacterium sp.]MDX1303630.1 hypothetical protein [Photobacterium sp.]